ncbi:MAG: cation-translocating P-type ATPase [Clostridia bacterium]|nr:cation-translocating P-type ATPase [Clostridia bacterium]
MHQLRKEEVAMKLNVDIVHGLNEEEVKRRLAEYGPNAFEEKKPKTLLQMFLGQLKDPMIYILMAAVVISSVLQEFSDAMIIMAVILLNAVVGVVQEAKAERSLEALKKLSSPVAMVRRTGKIFEIPASELVPGDVVVLEAGRIVPADLRLISSINLKIEESALTGESVPVEKDADFIGKEDILLGDRINMAYLSTAVSYGRGEGIVCYTAMETQIGKIAKMIAEHQQEMTPLQKRLADLGKVLGIVAVVLCVGLFAVAVLQGRDLFEMLLTAISLAVAAIPEGLPAVVTIVLALGVQRMVKVNTIVRRLPSVETLGSVGIVCSDKTGTLTQNKMTVTKLYMDEKMADASNVAYEEFRMLIEGMVLCTDATVDGQSRWGDPTELALVDLGIGKGITKKTLEDYFPRINEQPFDSVRKMMTTVHKGNDGRIFSYTKGAMDNIIKRCTQIFDEGEFRLFTEADKERIEKAASSMAADALRVLALAIRTDNENAQEDSLSFVGLVGMIDPPRPEAAAAVQIFKEASIITVMITGDHKDTAFAIAKELGIADKAEQCIAGDELAHISQTDLNERVMDLRVFARVSPENKVMIVNAFKSHGYIVSMTGDGVNDAPSLNAADIGVAMGITGTDVAKGAADMVLTDDNFASIQKAIHEGRVIYNNIRKTVLFLLSSNFGEIITMCTAIIVGLLSPLKAIHILWVNLITDSLPALGLGVDEGTPGIMKEKPRDPKENLFANGGLATTLFYGTVIATITLGAFLIVPIEMLIAAGRSVSISGINEMMEVGNTFMRCQTYAFTTLAVSQLFHAMGMRDVKTSVFRMNYSRNRMFVFAFFFGLMLQVIVTEIPFFEAVFETVELSVEEWGRLLVLSTAPLWFHELIVLFQSINKRESKS